MCRQVFLRVLTCLVIANCTNFASAAIKLPGLIGDNMVLQRGRSVPVWGWAEIGEKVTVRIAGQTLSTEADDAGHWQVTLGELPMGKPLEMTVRGASGKVRRLKNIAVGDVWLCAGQSNMAMGIANCNHSKKEIAAAGNPQIRFFQVPNKKSPQPTDDLGGRWKPCTPKNVTAHGWGGFSAVAYFFGRSLQKELHVPIGLISSSWGGTAAELWMSRDSLVDNPALKSAVRASSGGIYNAMIHPLAPFRIRGAVWYQGESNVGRAYEYRAMLPALIANWRHIWCQGDFPFGIVQIAPFRYVSQKHDPRAAAELREAQLMAIEASPNTGLIVTMDVGDVKDIHPKNKQEVGRRIALWALAKVYGRDVVDSGPIYKSMAVEGNKIRLQYEHVDGGLVARNGKPLSDFIIAAADEHFVPAIAVVDGDTILVHSDQVAHPVAVRFAWRDDATPNLANKAGLPASSFRTDAWKGVTEP